MKMTMQRTIGFAGAAVLVIGGLGFAVSHASSGKGPYWFDTTPVQRGDVAHIISASGAVEPVTKIDVGSEVSGKIVKLDVDFNDKVTKNQELAQIDPSTFQSAVDQAKAILAQSQAQVAAARTDIEHADVALDIAQKTWARDKLLFDKGALAQVDWETADRDYQFAQVAIISDKATLQSAQAGLEKAQASLADSQVQLAKTVIRSPIDGVVIARAVDLGQTVQSSMTVANFFTVAQDTSQIQIEAAVVESDMDGVAVGDPATFSVDAFPGERFRGTVTQVRVLGVEEANVVTYTVVISARNDGSRLMPGMTANAEITARRAANVLRISNEATKFQPPKDLLPAIGGGQKRADEQAGLNPSGEDGLDAWLKASGVDDARIQTISVELKNAIDALHAASLHPSSQPMGGGSSPMAQQLAAQDMRTKVQQATDIVLKRNLSLDAYNAVNSKRDEAASQKHVSAYVVDANGKLQRKMLVLGLSDGNFSEVIDGAREGEAYVVKAHAAGEKKPKPPATPMGRSPLSAAPQGGRGAGRTI